MIVFVLIRMSEAELSAEADTRACRHMCKTEKMLHSLLVFRPRRRKEDNHGNGCDSVANSCETRVHAREDLQDLQSGHLPTLCAPDLHHFPLQPNDQSINTKELDNAA